MVETLEKLNAQIKAVKDKRRKLFEDALDGRTQKWLSEKTGIAEPRISACISGAMDFKPEEISLINDALGTNF